MHVVYNGQVGGMTALQAILFLLHLQYVVVFLLSVRLDLVAKLFGVT